jgi:hypothetical protein
MPLHFWSGKGLYVASDHVSVRRAYHLRIILKYTISPMGTFAARPWFTPKLDSRTNKVGPNRAIQEV